MVFRNTKSDVCTHIVAFYGKVNKFEFSNLEIIIS